MTKGLMIHSQLSDYFGFLGLPGYKKAHCYHYFAENQSYKELSNYYLRHYNKLIVELPLETPQIIPEDWYQFTRQQVTGEVRETAVSTGLSKWISWEKETKKLYEKCHAQLLENGDVAAALFLEKYIEDVDMELAEAQEEFLSLSIVDFDFTYISDRQPEKEEKYKNKLREMWLC